MITGATMARKRKGPMALRWGTTMSSGGGLGRRA